MSGMWLISTVVLWLLVIGLGLVILALAREIEALHIRLDSLYRFMDKANTGSDGRGSRQDIPPIIPEDREELQLRSLD